jgi:uncharacterized protein YjbI with pentapeptide repeats
MAGAVNAGGFISQSVMTGGDLGSVGLNGAVDLHGAGLNGADLHGAGLHGANLNGVGLNGADFSWADLGMVGLAC